MAMLANGRVVATADDRVWVESIRRSTCGNCSARRGCGHHLLAGMGRGEAVHVVAVQDTAAGAVAIGDHVEIAIPERALLAGVGWAYLLPLLTLMAGLLIGATAGDGAAALGALVGLGVGVAGLAWRSRHFDHTHYQPRVVGPATGDQCAAETMPRSSP